MHWPKFEGPACLLPAGGFTILRRTYFSDDS